MAAELLMDGSFCPHWLTKARIPETGGRQYSGAALARTGALSGAEYTETPPPRTAIITATFKHQMYT